VYLKQLEPDRAIEHLQKALASDPGFGESYYKLAVAYLERSQPEAAESAARRAINADRGIKKAQLLLGVALISRDRFTQETFDVLTHVELEYPTATLMFARYFAGRGDLVIARSKLMTFLARDPEWGRVLGEQ
jgi:tetratricopeptide (TPR) repeat protein